jgi:hypothetical protein
MLKYSSANSTGICNRMFLKIIIGKAISAENNRKEEPNNSSYGDTRGNRSGDHGYSDNNNNKHRIHNKCESLDEGTFAFMHWMNSEDKKSLTSDNPIVLVRFVNDKHTILYDTDLQSEVDIEINKGVPYCKHCKADDCSHVGFAICVEQFYGYRRGSGREETVEDIILDN